MFSRLTRCDSHQDFTLVSLLSNTPVYARVTFVSSLIRWRIFGLAPRSGSHEWHYEHPRTRVVRGHVQERVLFHCRLDSHFPDDERRWASFHMLMGHCKYLTLNPFQIGLPFDYWVARVMRPGYKSRVNCDSQLPPPILRVIFPLSWRCPSMRYRF